MGEGGGVLEQDMKPRVLFLLSVVIKQKDQIRKNMLRTKYGFLGQL